MEIILYKCNCDDITVDKSGYLTNSLHLNMKLLDEDISLQNPTVRLLSFSRINGYDYCYIPKFQRYYFINNNSLYHGPFQKLSLDCDVLHTYRSLIYSCDGYVTRYQNGGNFYLPDKNIEIQTNKQITPLKGSSFTGEPVYLLTVAGGRQ